MVWDNKRTFGGKVKLDSHLFTPKYIPDGAKISMLQKKKKQ